MTVFLIKTFLNILRYVSKIQLDINQLYLFIPIQRLVDRSQNVLKLTKLDVYTLGLGFLDLNGKNTKKIKSKNIITTHHLWINSIILDIKKIKRKIFGLLTIFFLNYSLKSIFPNISLVKNIGFDGQGLIQNTLLNFFQKNN